VITDYFPMKETIDLSKYRLDRVMYGSDFPNIPYEWDRELKVLGQSNLNKEQLDQILYKTAIAFFNPLKKSWPCGPGQSTMALPIVRLNVTQ